MAEHMYKVWQQYGSELHWYCKVCRSGAEKLLAVMTKVQTKVDKLEEELVRVKAEIRAEVSNAFKELKNDIHNIGAVMAIRPLWPMHC